MRGRLVICCNQNPDVQVPVPSLQSCTGHGKVGVKIWGRTRGGQEAAEKLAEEASGIAACPSASPANAHPVEA